MAMDIVTIKRPACQTCIYWMAVGTFGQCRRNPPAIILTPEGARARWPQTNQTDWCGEHATVEEASGL